MRTETGESHRSQVKSDFSLLPSLDITCRMVSAKLTILMTLVTMLVIVLRRCEGYSPQPSEDIEGLERQARAPFNGMRGKRLPLSLNMYKKVIRSLLRNFITSPSTFIVTFEESSVQWNERKERLRRFRSICERWGEYSEK